MQDIGTDEKETKTRGELLKESLFYEGKNLAAELDDGEIAQADSYCEDYKAFLRQAKTEREAVEYMRTLAREHGFEEFDKSVKYERGAKIFKVNRGKAIILAVMGSRPLSDGVHLTAAHIDSPRLDLKQNPLYEDTELAFFKTHYYGGIKKYQWTTIPLALHGVALRADGTRVEVRLGEDEGDPQFCVTDLLPHLAKDQMKKPMAEAVPGESLNVIIGGRQFRDDKASELVKLEAMRLINEKYGLTEADFISAELTMVPAVKPVDIGFDRGLIGAYGHDDKVCAYPAATALFDCEAPEFTSVCVLTDKEEIGSEGNTGLNSSYVAYFIADLARPHGLEGRDVLCATKCLSADVNAAFDPNYPDVLEKRNSSFVNRGVVLSKFTGHGGKYDTNDASAEFTASVIRLFDDRGVVWQMGELGKVDQGGGGTVAKYIAGLDADVIDVGVPVLSMHAPFEIVSKLDVYETYQAMLEFYRSRL
jgi:aspartyl aminopeptidase